MAEKYTTAQIIEALREKHGNLSASARFLGCSRDTVRRYINTYPTVKAVADEERETLIDFAENQLFKQVQDGNITAIIFTLKTIGKSRGYVERGFPQEYGLRDVEVNVESEGKTSVHVYLPDNGREETVSGDTTST